MRVYFDHGATSFPKPPQVTRAMVDYMERVGVNVSRGYSSEALQAEGEIYRLREKLSRFFEGEGPENVCFTKNITESLNVMIHGFLQKGDRVLVSALEHNGVMRPLHQVGAQIIQAPVSREGILDLDFCKKEIPFCKAVVMTHISNVSGDMLPLEEVGALCAGEGVPFLIDSAQSAGFIPVSMKKLSASSICFTGHKSLLGPTGVGGFVLHPDFAKKVDPFITGGTGSKSDQEVQPLIMPDKFEAGTQNLVGLYGLSAAIDVVEDLGLDAIREKKQHLAKLFYHRLKEMEGLRILGGEDYGQKAPVLSLDFQHLDNAMASFALSQTYGIDNRCALHCSPSAHRSYGTFPQGTVRLSLGYSNTEEEVDYAAKAVVEILAGRQRG